MDDKKLAMVCCTVIACACVVADMRGVPLSSTTQQVLSIVIAGIMGAAAGYTTGKLEISRKPDANGK